MYKITITEMIIIKDIDRPIIQTGLTENGGEDSANKMKRHNNIGREERNNVIGRN